MMVIKTSGGEEMTEEELEGQTVKGRHNPMGSNMSESEKADRLRVIAAKEAELAGDPDPHEDVEEQIAAERTKESEGRAWLENGAAFRATLTATSLSEQVAALEAREHRSVSEQVAELEDKVEADADLRARIEELEYETQTASEYEEMATTKLEDRIKDLETQNAGLATDNRVLLEKVKKKAKAKK